jgi:catechol 2,3-dioxygenase-like lactoylglutathione lyase family enzyme
MGERGDDGEARQAAVLSDYIDLLNTSAGGAAATLAERATADGDLRRLLTIARLLSVRPDLVAVEHTSGRLRPWQHAEARDTQSRLPIGASGAEAARPAEPPHARDGSSPAVIGSSGPTTGSPADTTAPRSVLEVTSLDHVALPVSDLDRAVAFYGGVLGLRLINESRTPPPPTTPHIDFAAGQARVLVYQALRTGETTPRKTAVSGVMQFPHVALRVTDPATMLERLRASGHPFDGPIPSGAGDAAVHLWDPDGNQIDLIVPWPEGATL